MSRGPPESLGGWMNRINPFKKKCFVSHREKRKEDQYSKGTESSKGGFGFANIDDGKKG